MPSRVHLAVALVALTAVPAAAQPQGTIQGVVKLSGKAPERAKVRRDSDPYCDKTPALAEDIVVGADGGLRDVVVRIKNGTAGTHTAPADPVVLTQEACNYAPRVSVAMAGQPLAVKNADATYHNVHAWIAEKTAWNESHPAAAADIKKADVGKAGEVLELKCDVHPWMHAYVVVNDHPFATVTDDTGAFTIPRLPPGTYVVEAWHPALGLRTAKVTVPKGRRGTVKTKLTFKAPKPETD
jgi:plastocyanin